MRARICLVPLLLVAALLPAAALRAQEAPPAPDPAAAEATASPIDGLWQNPSNSVRVRIQPCGAYRCGVVEWASEKAVADSARGGYADLVGMTLLSDLTQVRPDRWRGSLLVPDMNRRFSGTMTLVEPTELRLRGCVLGGLVCRSQTWTRAD